jgi:hypothetical protein
MAEQEDDEVPLELASMIENREKEKSKKKGGKNAKKKVNKSAAKKKPPSHNNVDDSTTTNVVQSFQSHSFTSQSVVHLLLTSLPVSDSPLSLSLSSNDSPLYG